MDAPSPQDARALLRNVTILQGLADDALTELQTGISWRTVEKDAEVLAHLSDGDSIFFVLEGKLVLSRATPFGRSVTIRRLEAGDHFGEIAALIGTPRSLAVVTETETRIAECRGDSFRALMRNNAAFANQIAADLARTVVALTERLFEVTLLEMRFRLYSELLRLAGREEETPEGIRLSNAPSHEDLGAAIGATRESISRELGYLVRKGVIQTQNGFVISNPAELRAMVQQRAGVTLSEKMNWKV